MLNRSSLLTLRHRPIASARSLRSQCQGGIAIASLAAGLAFLSGCASSGTSSGSSRASARLSDEQVALNVESFDKMWEQVNEVHWDPSFNGVDWNAVHQNYRPRVESATTMREARAIMDEALGELKQSHFGIIPSEAYVAVEPAAGDDAMTTQSASTSASASPSSAAPSSTPSASSADSSPSRDRSGAVGLSFRFVSDECLVTMLRAGMPAEQAGIRTGYKLLAIDGRDTADLAETMRQSLHGSHTDELLLTRAIEGRLSGPVGTSVTLTLQDENNRRITKTLTRVSSDGVPATFGNLPTMYVTYDSGLVRNTNIGYIGLNLFFDPMRVMPSLQESIAEFQSADGIILDLRGNPGGIGAMAMGVAGWFIDQPDLKLGTMTTRNSETFFVINPRPEPYTGPLAILIDGLTGSTSEILAGGLQDLNRARIFGQRSPGAALPSQIIKLPNGDGFQFAFANYVTTTGRTLEGLGVTPDEVVNLDRQTLLRDEDPVINAAIAWIKSNRR